LSGKDSVSNPSRMTQVSLYIDLGPLGRIFRRIIPIQIQ